MRLPANIWPKTAHAQNGLFLAQTAKHLLERTAYESFRLPSLDLVSKIHEAGTLCNDIQKGRVSPRSLTEPLKELGTSLSVDIAARGLVGNDYNEYLHHIFSFSSKSMHDIARLENIIRYLYQAISPYYQKRLENEIISLFSDFDKEVARELISYYLSYIYNSGYSKQYISETVDEIFFTETIARFDRRRLKTFFKAFSGRDVPYRVWIPVTGGTKHFLKFIDLKKYRPISFDELPQSVKSIIESNDQLSANDAFLFDENEARDPFKSAESARIILKLFASTTVLPDRGFEIKSRDYAFVTERLSGNTRTTFEQSSRIQKLDGSISKPAALRLRQYVTAAVRNFELSSVQRVVASSENVALARSTNTAENQVVLLWSAIEVLFGDPPDDASRIDHYCSSLAPCVCLNYPWRYTLAVFNELKLHARHLLENALDRAEIESSVSSHTRFIALIFGPENRESRERFLIELHSNPGLHFLVYRLISRFSSPSDFKKSQQAHFARVRSQIHRIYRARNEFIHAGRAPSYIDTLAQNAYEYYRTALQAIFHRSDSLSERSSLDLYIESIAISYRSREKEIERLEREFKAKSEVSLLPLFDRR